MRIGRGFSLRFCGALALALDRRSVAPHSLRFKARLASPGIASCWVELKPKTLELTPDKVEEYFAEIGASEEIRRIWRDAGPSRKWKETYVKHAKTFVREPSRQSYVCQTDGRTECRPSRRLHPQALTLL